MATQVEHFKSKRNRDSLDRILSGATRTQVLTDAHVPVLIEQAIRREEGITAANGALSVRTGSRTGRSPKDRFIVQDPRTRKDVDWGPVNQPFSPEAFQRLWDRSVRHLASKDCIYVSHLQAGADSTHSIPLQIVTEYAWHALFATQLFVRPAHVNASSRDHWTVLSVPTFSADPERDETAADGAVILDLSNRRILVVGMRYAGEIKKAVFSAMNYLMPADHILPMHCASNVGEDGDVALFFGLSGTGKTTLSADPARFLIGDDEHGWNDHGIFNFEGGCYAKCINLSPEREPVIWDAICFGAVMENVVVNPDNRVPDYDDESLTQNSRVAYPRPHVHKRMPGNHAGHPQAVIFLTCDLFGVLPPVAILSKEQAAYHFLSGYTALVGSTEVGQIDEVKPTFSHCFGRPFFPRHPCVYSELLMGKVARHKSRVYLVNTGWTGGAYGDGGRRFSIATTRAIIHAIVRGDLVHTRTRRLENLNLEIPTYLHGIDNRILNPKDTWYDKEAYDRTARHLIELFTENFKRYEVDENIRAAGPRPG